MSDNHIKSTNKILISMFLTIFIDMIGVGILIPVYPLLILPSSSFNILPSNFTPSSGFIMLGWLTAIYPLAQFLFTPLLGQLADRFGRKKVLAISIVGTAISYIIFAIGIEIHNIPLLFISRFFDGITGGNIAVAQTIIGDISKPENRAKNFGLIGMAFGLGFIFGPFLGGRLSDNNTISWFTAATPFYFAAFLSLINVILVIKFVPETLLVAIKNRLNLARPLHNIFQAFAKPGIRNVMPSVFFYNAGFCFFTTFFGVTLAEKFHFTQVHIGDYFAYVGIMIILAQGVLVRKIPKQIKDYQILRFSFFGLAICLILMYLIPEQNSYLLYVIAPFLATTNALSMIFSVTIVTRVSPANILGETMGITSSIRALGQSLPAILSGYVAAIGANVPIIVGSLTIALSGILFWLIFNPQQFNDKRHG